MSIYRLCIFVRSIGVNSKLYQAEGVNGNGTRMVKNHCSSGTRGRSHKRLSEQMVGIMLVLKDWEDLPACYARLSFFLWSNKTGNGKSREKVCIGFFT